MLVPIPSRLVKYLFVHHRIIASFPTERKKDKRERERRSISLICCSQTICCSAPLGVSIEALRLPISPSRLTHAARAALQRRSPNPLQIPSIWDNFDPAITDNGFELAETIMRNGPLEQ